MSVILKGIRNPSQPIKTTYFINELLPPIRELIREVNRIGGDVVTTAVDRDVLTTDSIILCDDGLALNINLPYASSFKNRTLLVKKKGPSAHNVVVAAQSGETVDGAASQTLNQTYGFLEVMSDGVDWHVVRAN